MPRVSDPSGREPPSARWKARDWELVRPPIDSAGLKVRRDKRTVQTERRNCSPRPRIKEEREHGPGLVLSRGTSALPEAGGDERGVRASCAALHLRFKTILLLPQHLPDRPTPRGAQLLASVLSRLYNGDWAYTRFAAYMMESNSMVTARANFMSSNDATNFFSPL